MMKAVALTFFATLFMSASVASKNIALKPETEIAQVVSVSGVTWVPLNPARGDKGPKAASLWGDRTGKGPSGFLVKFVKGFSSPPHIHNVSYRGVAISGLLHNDDPNAQKMWMPAGSFWTQPAGETHITAAKGRFNLAYIEVDNGPFLVRPAKEAFDNGERPVNINKSNIVWLDATNITAIKRSSMTATASTTANGPKIAFLWGTPQGKQLNGSLIKLPAGFMGQIRSHGSTFRAIVIEGKPKHQGNTTKTLMPGSYFGSMGKSVHQVSCTAGTRCIIYVRTNGKYDIN